MLKQWLQFHFGASSHFTITLVHMFVMTTKTVFFLAWSQLNPVLLAPGQSKQSKQEVHFRCSGRRCLARIPFTIATQDCLRRLHVLLSWAVFSLSVGEEKENLFNNSEHRFLHWLPHSEWIFGRAKLSYLPTTHFIYQNYGLSPPRKKFQMIFLLHWFGYVCEKKLPVSYLHEEVTGLRRL